MSKGRPPGSTDRLLRRDALPEHMIYKDDGCEASPTCLTCPVPRCRYEAKGGLRPILNVPRDAHLVQMHQSGIPVDTIAASANVSKRTVWRVISVNKKAAA